MKVADIPARLARSSDKLEDEIRRLLKRRDWTLAELSSKLDRGAAQVEAALDKLRTKGYTVELQPETQRVALVREVRSGGTFRIDPRIFKGKEFRFGVVGESHLSSRYARLDVLNALYDIYANEGIREVFHTGNLIDGECRHNRFDLLAHGVEAQCAYAAENYPHRKNIRTRFICGDDHEGWYVQREGLNIGRVMQERFEKAGRKDLVYIGYLEADVLLPSPSDCPTWIRVMHPGGGTAYAVSYAPQKIVESFQGGEKPAVLIIGHFHKMDFCIPREVFCIQAGCTQDQTPFMRKKKIQAHVGGWICRLTQADDGHVSRLSAEFIRFYDRGFYTGEKFPRW